MSVPTQQSAAAPTKKGCSGIVVFMVATFCLVVGFIAGASGLYAYLAAVDGALETLKLDSPAPAPVQAQPTQPAPAAPSAPADAEPGAVYALVYPIEETLRIEGKLDSTAVRNRVTSERFNFQKCYQAELGRRPTTKGEVALQFTVSGSTGQVIAAVTRQNTTGSDTLATCVLDTIRGWKFGKIDGAQISVVRFDALFLPVSSAQAQAP